jgi:hypothetical protein
MNAVQIRGFVTGTWKYGTDRFVRLAVPRGPALPSKVQDEDREGNLVRRDSDHVSVRLPATLFGGVPIDFSKGQELEVVGFLQSRDYHESLGHFLKRANGPDLELPEDYDAGKLKKKRSALEVVAHSVARIDNGHQRVYVVDQEPLLDNAPVAHR